MATQTGSQARTITGHIVHMLEFPRWVIERDVDFTDCRQHGRYNEFLPECQECRFGRGCRWLDRNRTSALDDAPLDELIQALQVAVGYVYDRNRHKRHCGCESCDWLRSARRLLRTFAQ